VDKKVRIIPKRRKELDLSRLAEALLDVLAGLSPEDREAFETEGQRLLQEIEGGKRRKRGSAA
jgi:hypothetical protein